MKVKIIDLIDYSMEDWEGLQFFEQERASEFIRNRRLKKRAYIDKETKPDWWRGDDWKQTYTVRKIDKADKNLKKAIKELLKK